MWSSVTIQGVPRILIADLTQNSQGWEFTFSNRLCLALEKSELHVKRIEQVVELQQFDFNCLLVFAHSRSNFLDTLRSQQLPQYLLAVCGTDDFDRQLSESVLKSTPAITPLAIAPLSSVTPREAGLFYLKFFTELKLHSKEDISGKMVWFSFSKAKELLKRRRYTGRLGVRC